MSIPATRTDGSDSLSLPKINCKSNLEIYDQKRKIVKRLVQMRFCEILRKCGFWEWKGDFWGVLVLGGWSEMRDMSVEFDVLVIKRRFLGKFIILTVFYLVFWYGGWEVVLLESLLMFYCVHLDFLIFWLGLLLLIFIFLIFQVTLWSNFHQFLSKIYVSSRRKTHHEI